MVLAVQMYAFFPSPSNFFFFSNNKGRNSKKLQNRLELNIYHKKIHENGWKMVT